MDELIYLSRSKLRQFVRKPGRLRMKDAIAQVKAPFGSLKVSVEQTSDELAAYRKLQSVKAFLQQSERSPLWFEDESVELGGWIEFEAAMNYSVLGDAGQSLIFFLQKLDTND